MEKLMQQAASSLVPSPGIIRVKN